MQPTAGGRTIVPWLPPSPAPTNAQSMVLADNLRTEDGGLAGDTAMSISNLGSLPGQEGFPRSGSSGNVGIHLFNRDSASPYLFNTTDFPDVGTGTSSGGELGPGGTYTVLLNEVLSACLPDRPRQELNFTGYAWVLADFENLAGTAVNFFPDQCSQQSFQMAPPTGGIPADER